MKNKIYIGITMLVIVLSAQAAFAECSINGTITASPNPDPDGPRFMYTMVIVWDTDTRFALSHFNLLMDSATGTCTCQDFVDALSWGDPIGSSTGEPDGCTIDYRGILECNGDSSIPGVGGILLKFEPMENDITSSQVEGISQDSDLHSCEPGPTGTGTFVFYSDLAPGIIDEDIFSAVDKHGKEYCFGHMSGDFPAMACDPVGNEDTSWGTLKGMFR
ncbi:MAG: hypothetical protein ABFS42_03345 [Candidatus Krumholzibacteriota bacterium]